MLAYYDYQRKLFDRASKREGDALDKLCRMRPKAIGIGHPKGILWNTSRHAKDVRRSIANHEAGKAYFEERFGKSTNPASAKKSRKRRKAISGV